MPSEPSELMELCRLAVPWNAVNCSMNAAPITTTFLKIRMFSYLPALSKKRSFSNKPVVCCVFGPSSASCIMLDLSGETGGVVRSKLCERFVFG